MALYDALEAIKHRIFFDTSYDQVFVEQLAATHKIPLQTLQTFEGLFLRWKKETAKMTDLPSGFRRWCDAERDIIDLFLSISDPSLPRHSLFEEIALLLDRSVKSVSISYYNRRKQQQEEKEVSQSVLTESADCLVEEIEKNLEDLGMNSFSFLSGIRDLTKMAVEGREALKELDVLRKDAELFHQHYEKLRSFFESMAEIQGVMDVGKQIG